MFFLFFLLVLLWFDMVSIAKSKKTLSFLHTFYQPMSQKPQTLNFLCFCCYGTKQNLEFLFIFRDIGWWHVCKGKNQKTQVFLHLKPNKTKKTRENHKNNLLSQNQTFSFKFCFFSFLVSYQCWQFWSDWSVYGIFFSIPSQAVPSYEPWPCLLVQLLRPSRCSIHRHRLSLCATYAQGQVWLLASMHLPYFHFYACHLFSGQAMWIGPWECRRHFGPASWQFISTLLSDCSTTACLSHLGSLSFYCFTTACMLPWKLSHFVFKFALL